MATILPNREVPARVLRDMSVGYVTPDEVPEAKKLIDAQFVALTGKPFGYRPTGYFIALKIYIRPEELKKVKKDDGTEGVIYLPDTVRADEKYTSCAALVCAVGPQAYRGKHADGSDRYPEGPWCQPGDWVAIPRHESFLVSYRGVPMALLPDDKILGVIEDPTDISPIQQAAKI